MNLSQLRTQTRRYIQDTAGVEWSNAELNSVINDSYYDLQMELQMVNPEAIISWDTIDLTADENWYPMPPSFGLIAVRMKITSDATKFTKLRKKNYEDIVDLADNGDGSFYYTKRGDWIGIFPAPDFTLTDGLQIMHRPLDSLTADTDIPKLKLPLHQAICLQAKVFLLGDTNEDSRMDEDKLNNIKQRIGLLYMGDVDEEWVISPRGL